MRSKSASRDGRAAERISPRMQSGRCFAPRQNDGADGTGAAMMSLEMRLTGAEEIEKALVEQSGFARSHEGRTVKYSVPAELGTGYLTYYAPCEGIGVSLTRMRLKLPLVMHYEEYDSQLEISYCLSGSVLYSEAGVIDAKLASNDMGIYVKPRSRGVMMYPSDEDIFLVTLEANGTFFSSLPCSEQIADCTNRESSRLASALMKPKRASPQMSNLFSLFYAERIMEDLYAVHTESAAKLVLSRLWQDNIAEPLRGVEHFRCAASEMNALRKARDIIHDCVSDPPSIPELSRKVMLNEYKLKSGFRELYGKTIYAYIRELRMRNARELLENRDLSIGQIASEVGYVNTSHFARAFRKTYGINPSDLRIGA